MLRLTGGSIKDTLVDQLLAGSCFRLCSEEPALYLVEKSMQSAGSTSFSFSMQGQKVFKTWPDPSSQVTRTESLDKIILQAQDLTLSDLVEDGESLRWKVVGCHKSIDLYKSWTVPEHAQIRLIV